MKLWRKNAGRSADSEVNFYTVQPTDPACMDQLVNTFIVRYFFSPRWQSGFSHCRASNFICIFRDLSH